MRFLENSMWTDVLLVAFAAIFAATLAVIIANLVMIQRDINYQIEDLPTLQSAQFSRQLAGMVNLQFSSGNQVHLLLNGRDAFPRMFGAVQRAERSVTFENYVYWSGDIGRQFAELLAEKARQGVRVHVLLDWVGSLSVNRHVIRVMKNAGVELHRYHPPRFGGMHRLNHRTHRRELVVDGKIAFTGGVGFGDQWQGDGESKNSLRDNHYEIHGPVVCSLQAVFLDNWLKNSGDVLIGEAYYPELPFAGKLEVAILGSTPAERATHARLLMLLLVAASKKLICLEQSYFVPDKHLLSALMEASQRGVTVQILLPGDKIDNSFVRSASRNLWQPLLKAGVQLYEYQPSMLHTKISIFDNLWTVVGSTNLDYRSLYRNDEILLVTRDHAFARRHFECFEQDKQACIEVTLDKWQSRPLRQKLGDWFAALLRTQL